MSKSFKIKCPECGQILEAEEEQRGLKAQCPFCNSTMVVPPKKSIRIPKPINPVIPQTWNGQQTFGQIPQEEPASPLSFKYHKADNKFKVIGGDYPTIFALIEDFCSESGLHVKESDVMSGRITIKYRLSITHFVFFYQDSGTLFIETACDHIFFPHGRQIRKLVNTIEESFYLYQKGQYMPYARYDDILPPPAYQKAEIDYISQAKS